MATNVYDGNGTGGTYPSTSGLVKFGKSKEAGKLTLVYEDNVKIETIVFYVEGWSSSDKLKVNGQSYDLSITETHGEKIIVTLDVPTYVIEIEVDERGFLFALALYGPEAAPQFHEVEFDYNDEETQNNIVEVLSGIAVLEPKDPSREGYTFEGWFEDLSEETSYDFATNLTDNLTLIAKWEKIPSDADYSGTYQSDFTMFNNAEIIDDRMFKNVPANLLTITENSGSNKFIYYDAGTGPRLYNGGTLEITVGEGYKITGFEIKTSNGSASAKLTVGNFSENITFANNEEYNYPGLYGDSIKLEGGGTTIFSYFKFTILKEDGGSQPEPTKYDVAFNSNGGSAVATIEDVVDGSTIDKPADPTKTGFVFDGWYKESGLINEWNFATDTVTSNITLYAKWAEEQSGGEPEPDLEPRTITLTESAIWNSKTDSYLGGNFEKEFNGMNIKADDAGIYTGSGGYGDDKIQVRKDYGWIYNTNIPDGYIIKSITINGKSEGTTNIYFSTTTSKPTTNGKIGVLTSGDVSDQNYTYFYIKDNNGSGTITIESIVIELIPKD